MIADFNKRGIKMAHKELASWMWKNVLAFAKLSERINRSQMSFNDYSRTQMQLLIRLYLGGRVRLKDLAAREFVPAPNLCTAFRKMERDGLVIRAVDEDDRRNTWYSVSERGATIAADIIEMLHNAICEMFKDIDKKDEEELIRSFKSMNDILLKMENKNA